MRDKPAGWDEETLAQLRSARRVVVLTGAGMSAESGIPTFRDALTGHWSRFRPEELATPEAFEADPERVWGWYEARREGLRAAAPHAGHRALARLESVLADLVIVTQNVDGFHQQAGSSRVIELHGNILRSVCSETRREISHRWLAAQEETPPRSPHHPRGLARPDVVWFGEALPAGALEEAWSLAGQADVLLSIGTSSLVQPAASLPLVALEAGAWVVEVNPDPTPLSRRVHRTVRGAAGACLTELQRALSRPTAGIDLTTQRLRLRWMNEDDADQMLAIWNDPDFIRHVGDRRIRTRTEARQAMRDGILRLYAELGYGPYLVESLEDATPMGICGLFKRDSLDDPDIGYCLLPRFRGCGYALEAARAVLDHARDQLGLSQLKAIVSPDNTPSVQLLEKLDMRFEKVLRMPGDDEDVAVYHIVFKGASGDG